MVSPLSNLSDPVSFAKIQILLVPVHLDSALSSTSTTNETLTSPIYEFWTSSIKRYQSLRGDELVRPRNAVRSTGGHPSEGRARFFSSINGGGHGVNPGSISIPQSLAGGGGGRNVHLSYPSNPPARHLYPLSLLRMSNFPLIVIGIAVNDSSGEEQVKGFSVEKDDEDEDGDLGEAATPTAPNFQPQDLEFPQRHQHQHQHQDRRHKSGQGGIHTHRRNREEIFQEKLDELLPPTSPFPLVKRLLVVPPFVPRSSNSPKKSSTSSSVGGEGKGEGEIRFAPPEGVDSWLGGVMGELVGELLGELGEIATALETPAGLKTLSATLLPSLTATLPQSHLDNIVSARSRESTDVPSRPSTSTPVSRPPSQSFSIDSLGGMGISLTRAITPGGRPTSIQPPSLPPIQTSVSPAPATQPAASASSNPFRRSTALTSPFTRTSSAASSSTSPSPTVNTDSIAKYTSAPLTGVAGGRLLKLLGEMYLLSGMYSDSIKCFDDAAERCRSVGDVLWEAMAREGRAVAGIGEAWEARDGSTAAQSFSASPIPVEIISHYLSALSCLSRAPLPYPPTILSPSPQAISGSLTIPAPTTANPANIGTGEGLLAYLHSGLSLRISHFNLLIWAAGGWGSIALSSLMTHTLPRSFLPPSLHHESTDQHSRRKRTSFLGTLSAHSQLTRLSILGHAEQALAPHHRAMTKAEQLAVHVEVVWLTRWLGLSRKEAAYTRELVKRLAIMVVEGREETRRLGAGGFPSRSAARSPVSSISAENKADAAAAVGLGLGMSVPTANVATQAVAVRRKESTEGNVGIISLFENICEVLGMDLLQPGYPANHRFSTQSITHGGDDELASIKKFGWPELQVEIMKEGIAISEALPDHSSIVRLALSTLNSLYGYLNPQSQSMLSKMYTSALATVRRRGLDFGAVPWWVPGKMVLSLEIASLTPNRQPIEHSREEIVVTEGKKDPFLYNPRLKAAEAGKTVLVANEQVDIFVTVRNPFTFDLEIQDLSILTSGVPFITSPLPLTLPASSIQTVRVVGNAPSAGLMQVRGVSIRLVDGSSGEFLLPIVDNADKQRRDKRRSRLAGEVGKTKKTGLDARSGTPKMDAIRYREEDSGTEKWIECNVVEEQPLAWIKRTSLTHGTVMLYNGESSTIKITLENSSSVPIDFIKLSFDDTTSRDAQQAIQEGELSPEHAYEVEWDQLNRPVFTWEKEDGDVQIPPGGRTTISVRCLGKVGCTDGTIRIDYGFVNRSSKSFPNGDTEPDHSVAQNTTSNAFHTRQITFPVLFTVYHTIECHSLDLIRLDKGLSSPSSAVPAANGDGTLAPTLDRRSISYSGSEDAMKRALEKESDHEHCLLSLSVRNVYGVPFEVSLNRKKDEDTALVCTRLVPPGATERLFLPLPRRSIPKEILDRPVPSLSERQYLVDKEKKSLARIKSEREMFWYREELLNLINVAWTEPGSLRRGTLSMRGQFFHPDLLDVFRSDGIEVKITFNSRTADEKQIRALDFGDISVEVINRIERPFRPYVHLDALPSSSTDTSWTSPLASVPNSRRPISALNPHSTQQQQKNVLIDGLSGDLLPLLQPKEKGYFTVGTTFLTAGKYGFRAAVEQVQDPAVGGSEEGKVFFSPVMYVQVI